MNGYYQKINHQPGSGFIFLEGRKLIRPTFAGIHHFFYFSFPLFLIIVQLKFTMKDYIYNPDNFKKIEFWAATTIFVFAVFFLTSGATDSNKHLFDNANITFYYYQNFFLPQLIQIVLLYGAFWVLNFKIIPNLLTKKALFRDITFVILIFIAIGLVFGITDTYLKNYLFKRYPTEDATYNYIFQRSFIFALWLLFILGFYTIVKYAAIYLLSNSEAIQSKNRIVTRDGLIAFVLWMVSMFLLILADAEGELIIGWGLIGPCSILLYLYSIYALIPVAVTKKKPFRAYILRTILFLLFAFVPVALLGFVLSHEEEFGFGLGLFNTVVQLFIIMPLSWVLFKRQVRGNEEIYVLKKELGHSNANLDFLRSQINPHFLFNALNTIYGTAIQEKAERTGEGIERLGDMMRFMLQENMQEKISLAREVEYLNNYIGLQKLRTDPNPNIKIDTAIDEQVNMVQIAPMLLIPFVENAFKHGISFREPSHIKTTLEVKEKKLYFDVYNSKHPKSENDPEKHNTGIGLENVKQRLQLLYPGKHELMVRETGKEFFIHLTLQLA